MLDSWKRWDGTAENLPDGRVRRIMFRDGSDRQYRKSPDVKLRWHLWAGKRETMDDIVGYQCYSK